MKTRMYGMSLVEVIIISAAFAVVGMLLLGILVNNNNFFYKQNAVINVGLSLNDAMAEMTNVIRQGAQVATGYPVATPTYISGPEVLVIKLPSMDISGNPLSNVYDYAVIAKDSPNANVLRLQVFPDVQSTRQSVNKVLSTYLSSIQFNYFDKNSNIVVPTSAASVEVDLTIISGTGNINSTRTSKIKTMLRNSS